MKSRSSASDLVRSQRRFASETVSSAPAVYLPASRITALRFSPDGQTLAVSGNREVLLIAPMEAPGETAAGQSRSHLSIAFSADGNLMIAGAERRSLRRDPVLEPREGRLLRTAEATNDTVFGASLSPDASRSPSGCADNTVRAFDTATGSELYKSARTRIGCSGRRSESIPNARSVGRDRAPADRRQRRTVPGDVQQYARRARRRGAASESRRDRDSVGEERFPTCTNGIVLGNMKVR